MAAADPVRSGEAELPCTRAPACKAEPPARAPTRSGKAKAPHARAPARSGEAEPPRPRAHTHSGEGKALPARTPAPANSGEAEASPALPLRTAVLQLKARFATHRRVQCGRLAAEEAACHDALPGGSGGRYLDPALVPVGARRAAPPCQVRWPEPARGAEMAARRCMAQL